MTISIRAGLRASISLVALLVLLAAGALASSNGIDGFSGDPATNGLFCNVCHSGGIVPTVTLSGPTVVQPNTVQTYLLRISGGQQRGGGLDVSATGGVLLVVDPETQLQNGEVTHTDPRSVDGDLDVTWEFRWRAPAEPGPITLYAAGNSVNLSQGSNGDAAAVDTLLINVLGASQTSGETSGPSADPLLVTGFDRQAGELSLSFANGCNSTSNNIYFGPLDQVATHGWSEEVCGIGTGPELAGFDPGEGSLFFVVVGNNGGDEGSYGALHPPDGPAIERPPFVANLCGQVQTLTATCDQE